MKWATKLDQSDDNPLNACIDLLFFGGSDDNHLIPCNARNNVVEVIEQADEGGSLDSKFGEVAAPDDASGSFDDTATLESDSHPPDNQREQRLRGNSSLSLDKDGGDTPVVTDPENLLPAAAGVALAAATTSSAIALNGAATENLNTDNTPSHRRVSEELTKALSNLQQGPIKADPAPANVKPRRRRRLLPLMCAAILICIVAIIVVAVLVSTRRSGGSGGVSSLSSSVTATPTSPPKFPTTHSNVNQTSPPIAPTIAPVVATSKPTDSPPTSKSPSDRPTLGRTNAPTKTPIAPTQLPTLTPTTVFKRYSNLLLPFANASILFNTATPQGRAFATLSSQGTQTKSDARILQRYALLSIFFATSPNSWLQTSGWINLTDNECTFFGVGCQSSTTGDVNVTNIQLASNGLSGSFPSEICMLGQLDVLNLSDNALSGNIPECLINLKKLTRVSLQRTNLTGDVSSSLCTLNLTSLATDCNGQVVCSCCAICVI